MSGPNYQLTLQLVEQVINVRQGVSVLHCNLVQLPIVSAQSHGAILLLHKQHWCTLWRETRSNETLVHQLLQLSL